MFRIFIIRISDLVRCRRAPPFDCDRMSRSCDGMKCRDKSGLEQARVDEATGDEFFHQDPCWTGIRRLRRIAPALKLAPVDTVSQIEAHLKRETFDAVVMPAESGSVLTLLYPKFTVVVPEPDVVKIPLAVSGGPARSRMGPLRQYLDRVKAARRHYRRALPPLDSREGDRQAPTALVDHAQCVALGGLMTLKVVPLPTQSFRAATIGPRSNIQNGSLTISHIG